MGLPRLCAAPHRAHGGRDTLANVVPACRSCNTSTCNDVVIGWLRRQRLDERAFLLRHLDVTVAITHQLSAAPNVAPPAQDHAYPPLKAESQQMATGRHGR